MSRDPAALRYYNILFLKRILSPIDERLSRIFHSHFQSSGIAGNAIDERMQISSEKRSTAK